MRKLTVEKCQSVIKGFRWMAGEGPGMSIRDEYDLQAYQIAIQVLEQQGGWISCSEQVPAPLDWVIAYDQAGTVKAYICQHTGEWIRDNGDELYQVTHWQPLPAPPNSQANGHDGRVG